ncbi:hypothetical protein XM38_024960 [Halomicronema hongdechloris C2206]|uniref:Uncharacterized protein n=1 Tax=Halomicronema hongdechloris C2206 TaxID=1641165 RepID=A0A1Z3HMK2_9CYAN|nr:PD-(D/E)XK nuclease family protein [Halomicronema hongdechloris]ASC71544.1 hypothetical protein XM38_024960 [Halomicronema hongdechloris C2206]
MQLPHYQAQTVRQQRRRLYSIAGRAYPGVTTILSATKPPEARVSLQKWRQAVGHETAHRITVQASSAGTRLHKYIAAHLRRETTALPNDLDDYWASIEPVLAETEEVLLVEGAVWHDQGFAGIPDALVRYRGQLCLCDWKTARRPKQPEWLQDYWLQVAAAYGAAVNQVYDDYGIRVEHALIAIALADQPAQTFWLTPQALEQYWQGFQQRLQQYQNRQRWGLI